MQNAAFTDQISYHYKVFPKFVRNGTKIQQISETCLATETNIFSAPAQQEELVHDSILADHEKAKNCIERITDPLWQAICIDLLNVMGPDSVLKLWKSTLGEYSAQDKGLDITCEGETTASFVRQYDFVILGSLQRYFSALKQLRVKIKSKR